jgi:hypothetical protein
MANHMRKQIRDAVVARLTNLTTTGANVFQDRVYALSDEELPAIIINTENETSQPNALMASRLMQRELNISVTAYVKAVATMDDKLDQICKEVEIALATDTSLGGLTKDLYLTSTNMTLDGSGEQPRGLAQMLWAASYYVRETAPDVAQ